MAKPTPEQEQQLIKLSTELFELYGSSAINALENIAKAERDVLDWLKERTARSPFVYFGAALLLEFVKGKGGMVWGGHTSEGKTSGWHSPSISQALFQLTYTAMQGTPDSSQDLREVFSAIAPVRRGGGRPRVPRRIRVRRGLMLFWERVINGTAPPDELQLRAPAGPRIEELEALLVSISNANKETASPLAYDSAEDPDDMSLDQWVKAPLKIAEPPVKPTARRATLVKVTAWALAYESPESLEDLCSDPKRLQQIKKEWDAARPHGSGKNP